MNIIAYEVAGLWELEDVTPTMSQALQLVKAYYENGVNEGVNCGRNYCNNQGSCIPTGGDYNENSGYNGLWSE